MRIPFRAVFVAWFLLTLWSESEGAAVLRGQELSEARAALAVGEYHRAIATLERAARRDRDGEATRELVHVLVTVGRYDDAEEAARAFRRRNSRSAALDNALAEILLETGRWGEAEELLDRALTLGAADSLTARINRAELWYSTGRRSDAWSEFDRFIDAYNSGRPLSAAELTAVGRAVARLGQLEPQLFRDALRAYDEAAVRDSLNYEPRLRVGQLFLDKYNSTDARDSFESVLARNPNHPAALLGMARVARFEGTNEAFELAARSLEHNPHLAGAHLLLARMYLDVEKFSQAEQEVARVLEVNPNSLEGLALRAAVLHLRGDTVAARSVIGRALELNPSYGDLFVTLAELSARNRLYHDAARFGRRAVEIDSLSWRGRALWGINQLRVGQISEGRANLEQAFEGDPFDVWTKNTLDLLDTFDDYRLIPGDRVAFFVKRDESGVLGPYLATVAEQAFEQMVERYGFSPSGPIRVEVFPRHADFSVRTVGLAGMGALGVSFGPVIAMDSPSARDVGDFNWGSTLWHELAHTFHLELSGHRVPRWFTEGLAVYEERQARTGWGDDVTPAFLMAYREGRLHPVSELNNGFMRPSYPEQLFFSYYQASLVIELIVREQDFGAVVSMLEGFRDGESTTAVIRRVLSRTPKQFDRDFDRFLRNKFRHALESVESHGDGGPNASSYSGQMEAARNAFESGDLDRAERHLDRAKQMFPEYAGADSPYWYLAQLHRQRGDLSRAATELKLLTAVNERHYRANLELGGILEELNDVRGAVEALERTLFIYPFDQDVHRRLAEHYTSLGRYHDAVREREVLLALDPVDRAQALYQLARAQHRAGDHRNARRSVIAALEIAPAFDEALELLLDLESAGSQGGTDR